VKQAILTSVIVAAAVMAAGCKDSKSSTAANNAALSPAPVAYQSAPQPYTPPPVAAQPVVYDSAPAQPVAMVSSAPASTVSGGSYTVKKGDTLYSIAKSRYGAGNQYTKITAANPGLSPQSLKVGQTITIP
jgi:nucleoid-associated protein YgaU